MWIFATLLIVALLLMWLWRLWRVSKRGASLNSQLLSGRFDDSPLGLQLSSWFDENPNREVQRRRFVEAASAMGAPDARLGERVMRTIMRAWKETETGYGNILAEEFDEIIVFDPPTSDAQRERQENALAQLEKFKNELRRLDN